MVVGLSAVVVAVADAGLRLSAMSRIVHPTATSTRVEASTRTALGEGRTQTARAVFSITRRGVIARSTRALRRLIAAGPPPTITGTK